MRRAPSFRLSMAWPLLAALLLLLGMAAAAAAAAAMTEPLSSNTATAQINAISSDSEQDIAMQTTNPQEHMTQPMQPPQQHAAPQPQQPTEPAPMPEPPLRESRPSMLSPPQTVVSPRLSHLPIRPSPWGRRRWGPFGPGPFGPRGPGPWGPGPFGPGPEPYWEEGPRIIVVGPERPENEDVGEEQQPQPQQPQPQPAQPPKRVPCCSEADSECVGKARCPSDLVCCLTYPSAPAQGGVCYSPDVQTCKACDHSRRFGYEFCVVQPAPTQPQEPQPAQPAQPAEPEAPPAVPAEHQEQEQEQPRPRRLKPRTRQLKPRIEPVHPETAAPVHVVELQPAEGWAPMAQEQL